VAAKLDPTARERLRAGMVIPAHPLALTEKGDLDRRHQRALTRYYLAAGAGGVAVGVHTTQFAIREAGLLRPVLELAAATAREAGPAPLLIAGVCGRREQALGEAALARELGYDLGLVSLGALRDAGDAELIDHVAAVAAIIPVFGFYLQPSVGGRPLSHAFWLRLAELDGVEAIKVAPFNRYQTIDVVRAVAESSRAGEIALYTGNDDAIVSDLVTCHRFEAPRGPVAKRFVGGLLGQWAVWTSGAVATLERCRAEGPTEALLADGAALTDANAAIFDAANGFRGCIPGIQEVLRRQGLVASRRCLDEEEVLSPGQMAEIDRVCRTHPELADDGFVRANLAGWLD
jgi:hypothetical protein